MQEGNRLAGASARGDTSGMSARKAIALPASLLIDMSLRLIVALAVTVFAVLAFKAWRADPARISVLLVAVVEAVTVAIIVCSRPALRRDWQPLSVAASLVAMFYFLALDLAPAGRLIPEAGGVALQCAGLVIQLYAKLSLGRSFGVLPATRALVTHGAYRLLRHPIYFGYLVAHAGFLLTNFSWRNLLVMLLLYAAQLWRIRREEEILRSLPGYAEYCGKVRYRLLPWIY